MKSKLVNTNKNHKCGKCGEVIPKGTDCLYYEDRLPAFEVVDGREKQKGIYYYKDWAHNYNCDMPEECRKGNHNFVRERSNDLGTPTGNEICTECGTYKHLVLPDLTDLK